MVVRFFGPLRVSESQSMRRKAATIEKVKVQLHYAIYRLRFYSNSLIHILSLSNSDNNVASIQKNRGDKSHRVIVALYNRPSKQSAQVIFGVEA